MPWYTAHIIETHELREGIIEDPCVWENVILLEAKDDEDAHRQFQAIGEDAPVSAGFYLIDEKPAIRKFIGIRKMSKVQNPPPYHPYNDPPVHGTILSTAIFEFESYDDLDKFIDAPHDEVPDVPMLYLA